FSGLQSSFSLLKGSNAGCYFVYFLLNCSNNFCVVLLQSRNLFFEIEFFDIFCFKGTVIGCCIFQLLFKVLDCIF
ncbi:hypothetical protein UU9_17103, partial [Rhodanobacter fulvus Jip2]